MKAALRSIIALTLFGVISLSLIGCAGCRKRSSDAQPPSSPAPEQTASLPPEISTEVTGQFTGTEFSISLDGERAWAASVKSGSVSNKDGKQVFTLTGMHCRLYRQGRETLQVSADSGTAVRTGNTLRMELRGDVRAIETARKQRLHAETFRWHSTEDKIHATKFAWAGDGTTLRADRGTFSSDLTEATFTGNVRLETTGNPLSKEK